MKSVYLLLFTLVTVGNGGSRRSVCSTASPAHWHCAAIGWVCGWRFIGWLFLATTELTKLW